jgi:hypothetical protein
MVTQIIVAVASAGAGGFLGALFALYKLRRQTAFDRQMLWCENVLKNINSAGAALVSAQSSKSAPKEREVCWVEAIEQYQALIPLSGQKEIYASPVAIDAIRDFMREFHNLIEVHLNSNGADTPILQCNPCLDRLKDAAQRLAQEARRHLGLPKLKGPSADPSERFTGSFWGQLAPRRRSMCPPSAEAECSD